MTAQPSTQTSTQTPNTSPKAESALPTVARMPARLPDPRPTTGISFSRLVGVELRKQVDTMAGRWLLISIGVVIAVVLTILFLVDGGQHSFSTYLQATTMPMAVLLPVVGILAVTSEWSQRTGLVTFALEPRRIRVSWAKLVSSLIVGVAAFALSLVLAAAAHQAAITVRGIKGDWEINNLAMLGAAGYVLLGVAQGVAFGMLFRNSPAAIVVYFVLPTVWAVLGGLVTWLETPARWLELNRTMEPLFTGSLTGEQWAQLGTSVSFWVVLPLAVGIWRLTRAEVK